MCDDVELYKDSESSVSIRPGPGYAYLYLDHGWSGCVALPINPDRARQIGLGLIKWSDAQRDGAEHGT